MPTDEYWARQEERLGCKFGPVKAWNEWRKFGSFKYEVRIELCAVIEVH